MHRRTLRLAIGLLALLTLPGAVAAPRGRTITVSRSEAPLTSAWLGHAGPLALGAGNVSPRATSGRRPGGGPASAARLVAAADPQWSSRFSWGMAGPVGSVDALAYMGTDLYVGGGFSNVADASGSIPAGSIAKWDGIRWSTLNGGVSGGAVRALVATGGALYVGGFFTAPVPYIARWDGKTWSSLGLGVNDAVRALAVDGAGRVYVGGKFTAVNGGPPAGGIARWDPATGVWAALGAGPAAIQAAVEAIAIADDGSVYVGSNKPFTIPGYLGTHYIARWDGTAWSALHIGVDGPVLALAPLQGNSVLVGGEFIQAGGHNANHIAKWTQGGCGGIGCWSYLGKGFNGFVSALFTGGGNLAYIGGNFTQTTDGTLSFNHVAGWTDQGGGTWYLNPAAGVDDVPWALTGGGGHVYAAGDFTTANGKGYQPVPHVARLVNSTWEPLDWNGLENDVIALLADGSDLYAGGLFFKDTEEGTAAHVARWDGTAWHALGFDGGVNGTVNALAMIGDDLYVGGNFWQAGGNNASNIARWNKVTQKWSALGTGVDKPVYTLAVMGTTLYAGGLFTEAGGHGGIAYLGRWDGTGWSYVGKFDGPVLALAGRPGPTGALYAGGSFTTVNGVPASNIAELPTLCLVGQNCWSPLGAGINSVVWAIALDGPRLYAGGFFSVAGGVVANNVARWDGSVWHALGTGAAVGTDGGVTGLTATGGGLYVSGQFTHAGGVPAAYVASWNGTSWEALGSGADGPVNVLALSGLSVYVGGAFSHTGGQAAAYIGLWQPLLLGPASSSRPGPSGPSARRET